MRTRIVLLSPLITAAAIAGASCSSTSNDAAGASATSTASSAASAGGGSVGATSGPGGGSSNGGSGPIGGDRPVEVHVPPGYDAKKPAPLVLLLHGYTASGTVQEAYMQFQPLADKRGFLYAHPDGTKDKGGNRFWNATDACCDFDKTGVDDSTYLTSVIQDIKKAYNVDPKRVFLIGHSNGGFMSYRMACDHADQIAAIAVLAGGTFKTKASCKPSQPVALLHMHGTADAVVAYTGGNFTGGAFPGAIESSEIWAGYDGCAATADTTPAPLDLETSLMGNETKVSRYAMSCKPGGFVEHWRIEGGSHIPTFTTNFAPAVIDFLFAHPKP